MKIGRDGWNQVKVDGIKHAVGGIEWEKVVSKWEMGGIRWKWVESSRKWVESGGSG